MNTKTGFISTVVNTILQTCPVSSQFSKKWQTHYLREWK